MQHVFISYKREDFDFAENLIYRLEQAGFATWADPKIKTGEEWRTEIDLAVRDAFALVVIMTPEAKASEYVTFEWAFASGARVKIIPVMLRQTELHPRLETLQYLDFTSASARPWDRLIEVVRAARTAHQAPTESLTLYDSRNGFKLRDFTTNPWGDAQGKLALSSSSDVANDVLTIERDNTGGTFVVLIGSYDYKGRPKVVPVGDPADARRQFRVRFEVRAREAEHTLLVTLKMEGAPQGEYLKQWRHRINPGGWEDIDDNFDVSFSADCQFRIEDRSVSAAPSRLEIRRLVITELEPPQNLLPDGTAPQP